MKNHPFTTFVGSLLVFAVGIFGSSSARGDIGVLYYQFVHGGYVYGGSVGFELYTCDAECPAAHKVPNTYPALDYKHIHPTFDFPLYNHPVNGGTTTVTATMSDLAYAAAYEGYTKVSGSSFLQNCYSYANNAPTASSPDAWYDWTVDYTLCAGAITPTSTLVMEGFHCVVFTEAVTESPCLVATTHEKVSTGPVYTRAWYAPFDDVPYFSSSSYPIGKNR